MNRSAIISSCGLYRYELRRQWSNAPAAVFVGLNPSTADATQDDATIRRCVAFAQQWGMGELIMVNLFAWRATKPEDMQRAPDPVGAENDYHLLRAYQNAGIVIAAWGVHGAHKGRDQEVMRLLPRLHALRVNKDGTPGHPLYLPKTSVPFLL